MNTIKTILTCLLSCCISLLSVENAFAAKDRYTVEVIVFRQPSSPAVLQELWSGNLPIPTTESSSSVKTEPHHLNAISARLNRSGYPVLFHQASSVTLHHGGKRRSIPIHVLTPITHDWLVTGSITLQNSGFLQTNLKLLTQPSSSTPSGLHTFPEGSSPMLTWDTSRRVHAKELHYYDHPVYGMLVSIYPQA